LEVDLASQTFEEKLVCLGELGVVLGACGDVAGVEEGVGLCTMPKG